MSKEAMKLALEALELINLEFVCANGSHHAKKDRHEWDEDCPITDRWRKAITALREALAEQPAQQDSTCSNALRAQGKAYPRTCKKCGLGPCVELAQQALDKKAENARELGLDYEPVNQEYERGVIDGMQEQMRRSVDRAVNAMAQRTWVGLTDEDIDYLCELAYENDEELILTVQAKLKEKNT